MRLHKAKIVGLKPSKRLIGWYYPIFEYSDKNGETHQYIRENGMEITPYSKYKTYTIMKRRWNMCEKSEDGVLPLLRSPTLLTKPLMLLFVIPNTILLMLLSSLIPILIGQMIKVFKIGKMRRTTKHLKPIKGKIVGYRCGHRDLADDDVNMWCKPIIEYSYKDQIYYHTSRIYKHGKKRGKIGDTCDIYLDRSCWHVFDAIEVHAPLCWWFYQQIAIPMNTIWHCFVQAMNYIRATHKRRMENKKLTVKQLPVAQSNTYGTFNGVLRTHVYTQSKGC